jgi:2-amino-4-hydroxy-6-hydroxymethyldihydropteridine diphosphokinase
VRASLADQGGGPTLPAGSSLAIALGANLPSPAGPPLATLLALRPLLEQQLRLWAAPDALQLHWSPLFRSAPVGGPADQPDYLNAVLLVAGAAAAPNPAGAVALLHQLQELERCFGRERRERWGPRSLDLDLLWWGGLQLAGEPLELPHPRWSQRGFVLAPLQAIERRLGQPLLLPDPTVRLPQLIQALGGVVASTGLAEADAWPELLPGRTGWPE